MSDHSDISYISDDGVEVNQQQQQQRGGAGPSQQFRGRRPARVSHATSLGSSAGVGDLQDLSAATSWQVRSVIGPLEARGAGGMHSGPECSLLVAAQVVQHCSPLADAA